MRKYYLVHSHEYSFNAGSYLVENKLLADVHCCATIQYHQENTESVSPQEIGISANIVANSPIGDSKGWYIVTIPPQIVPLDSHFVPCGNSLHVWVSFIYSDGTATRAEVVGHVGFSESGKPHLIVEDMLGVVGNTAPYIVPSVTGES